MSDNIWENAEDERRAQEERERRRREILDKIHSLEQKKGRYRGIKDRIYCQNDKLKDIMSRIVILVSMEWEADTNSFTCVTEDTTAEGAVSARTAMREKNKCFSSVVSAGEAQIARLQSCIYEIEEEICGLKAQL